jgi:RHH-type transcriptional regulator, rel operon repressor / antitoxin RelB
MQDIAAADEAMESIRNGEPTSPLAEVKQRLGLDN